MRAMPLGFLKDRSELMSAARINAQITHDTRVGMISSQAVALMMHFSIYVNEDFGELARFLQNHLDDSLEQVGIHLREPWCGRVKCDGAQTVWAVHHILTHTRRLSEIIRMVIRFGGDTDSVAAIAAAIASPRHIDDLPTHLIDTLEPEGAYGIPYLRELGEVLTRTYCQT